MDAEQLVACVPGHPWRLEPSWPWLQLRADRPLRSQGWKLHVSADVVSFEAVARAALGVLAGACANAKLVSSTHELLSLNDGKFGLSQIGKVVTVYPGSDAEATELAVALDEATDGLRGPTVPFDRELRPGSLVHYRFGRFDGREQQQADGRWVSVVRRPDGVLAFDDRRVPVPEWATDPLAATGVAETPTPAAVVIGGRYALLGTVSRTARGSIHPALDLEDMRPCTAKRAVAWGTTDPQGRDARDRLRHERAVLERLAAASVGVPTARDIVDDGDDLILIMDELRGERLDDHVLRWATDGALPHLEHARSVGSAVADLVQQAHDAGVILRDLSAGNVLVGLEAPVEVHLVDLELAHVLGDPDPPFARGTHGFASPAQIVDVDDPIAGDDIFGLGSLLWFLVTGRHPAIEPGLESLTPRRLRLAAPGVDDELAAVVRSCLSRDPGDRPGTAAEVAARLDPQRHRSGAPGASEPAPQIADIADAFRAARRQLLDDLRDTRADPRPRLDLGNGSAGLILAALTLAELLGDEECADAARLAAPGLAQATSNDWTAPGLFTGRAGIAAALSHPLLGEGAHQEVAVQLARSTVELPAPSADLVNGSAGIVRGLLLVADATGARDLVRSAEAAATSIVEKMATTPVEHRWMLPDSVERGACLGYGHGAAGIADVLIDLGHCLGDDRWLHAAVDIAAPVLDAVPSSTTDPAGWPNVIGGPPSAPVWCRGAGGASLLLTRLGHQSLTDVALQRIAATRWTGPSRCHGLAGQIELLVDAERPADAAPLAELVAPFVEVDPDPAHRWLGPGLLEGNAGVAVALARCLRPERRPWSNRIFGSFG